ncbi:DUF6503 family protein [Lewinella sp. W8]|uniref:DUF6503 family protein n=1 Tax=Lewinella sp. W8 TaxID=2528208 RepID=UPI00106869DF|nr:DUF6503 family protein [Lewinella sp. W8]MTB49832.1 DUF2911 domain-containing protein [Lewinella sp. W8]
MKPLLFALCCFPLMLFGQFEAPPASPPATNSVQAGYTNLSVTYHRPNVRGRDIFGALVPWEQVWRAGANDNTLLELSGMATIGEHKVAPGQYSLYFIPKPDGNWILILNSATDNWGTRGYSAAKDVLRQTVKARRLAQRIETLEYRWMNLHPQSVDLVLEWGWWRVSCTLKLPTDAQVAARAEKELERPADPNDFYLAARYYLDNDLDLGQAKAWMDHWEKEGEEQFGRMRYQAIIEYKLGNTSRGVQLMKRSLELARKAGNAHYVSMNERSLREWERIVTEIDPEELLRESITYHDPESQWNNRTHLIQLAESRPGGSVRHTRLSFNPGKGDFDMQQTRGKDKIQLRYLGGTYGFSHNGRTNIGDSTRQRLNLTEDRTNVLRDYYSYLWGLPMKLRDPGTLIQPTIHQVWFADEQLLEMEVHYAPDTGKDIWFFYFDPVTKALRGYAFYHDKDGPGTGEYIILEDEALVEKMRIPARRHWYQTQGRLYLGTDEILK